MELLNIQQIEKYYGNKSSLTKAIDDISFSVAQGEFLAIMGASGSGKTTLLNCISTIDRVTAGHIYLENTDITTLKGKALNKFRREKLGFIFQDFNLLDTLTAYENISLALSIQKRSASEIDTAVKTVAQQLGITEVLQKYPYQMSGGQKQRVALARTMVMKPRILLLDEPTNHLDIASVEWLEEYLVSYEKAIIMVSHDRFFIDRTAEIIYELSDGKLMRYVGNYTEYNLAMSIPVFSFGYKEACEKPKQDLKTIVETTVLLEILAGNTSNLYNSLFEQSLINESFSKEYFIGYGYESIIFDGESENPKEVAKQIKKEVERLKNDGITDDEFESARRSLYGKEIMSYNDIDTLANGLVAAHFGEYDMLDIVEIYKNITKADVLSRLAQVMDEKYSALSVVKQCEE